MEDNTGDLEMIPLGEVVDKQDQEELFTLNPRKNQLQQKENCTKTEHDKQVALWQVFLLLLPQ